MQNISMPRLAPTRLIDVPLVRTMFGCLKATQSKMTDALRITPPIMVFLMPRRRRVAFRSALNSLSLASASVSETPCEVKKSRMEEADSPQMILALASERMLFGSVGSGGGR